MQCTKYRSLALICLNDMLIHGVDQHADMLIHGVDQHADMLAHGTDQHVDQVENTCTLIKWEEIEDKTV